MEKALAVRGGQTGTMSLTDIIQAADMVVKAKLFPGFDSPEKVATLMMLAQAEGCHPIQAMTRYDIIQGRPAKKPQAMLEDFIGTGGQVEWTEASDQKAEAIFTPAGGKPQKMSYTMAQAKRAKLSEKPTWKQYPEAMLRARLISAAMRMISPSATGALYTPEEVDSFTSSAEVVQEEKPEISEKKHLPPPYAIGDMTDAEKAEHTVETITKYQAAFKALTEDGIREQEFFTTLGAFGANTVDEIPVEKISDVKMALKKHFVDVKAAVDDGLPF